MDLRPFSSAVALPLRKLWQLILQLWQFIRSRGQLVFDFLMDRIVTWLCRYYQPAFDLN